MDTNAVFLNKLLASKEINTLSRFKIYGSFCAYHFREHRDLPKALAYADSMILVVKNSDPELYSKELAQGYFSKGDVLFALGKYEESFDNYHTAKRLMAAKKDNCINSDYSYRIGMVLYKQGQYADAGYFFDQGFKEAAACKQDFSLIFRRQELLNNVALCYAKRGQRDSALLGYTKALAYINEHDTIPEKKVMFEVARGVVYGNIGSEYFFKKDYSKAEGFFLKSININSRPHYENNDAALTRVKLVKLYFAQHKLDSVKTTIEALKGGITNRMPSDALQSYHQLMSQYLEKLGRKEEAFEHLKTFTLMADSLHKLLEKMNATDINERFRNLDSQNEIYYLKREKEVQAIYLYVTILLGVMALVIVLLVYFYLKKSKKNIAMLTQLNDEILLQQQRLEHTLNDLEVSNNEKDRILRAVAHDLRNPIAGISSLVSLSMEDRNQGEEAVFNQKLIKDTCEGALSLINELIQASESGQLDVEPKVTRDVNVLIASAVSLLKFKAREKNQTVTILTAKNPVRVNLYEDKIFRVISNLISNAIKFSEEGSEISINLETNKGFVHVEVIDTGIGVPDHLVDAIFQVFTSAKRTGTMGEKSYGLGLSICKQIVEAHGGKISYRKNQNQGSVFSFSLPLA